MYRATLQTAYLSSTDFLFETFDEATTFIKLAAEHHEKAEGDYDHPQMIIEEVEENENKV